MYTESGIANDTVNMCQKKKKNFFLKQDIYQDCVNYKLITLSIGLL